MLEKLSQKDKRALRLGILGIATFILIYIAMSGIGRWVTVRGNISTSKSQLAFLASAKPGEEIKQILPVLKIPQNEEAQKNLFRTEFNNQMNRSGLKAQPIKVTTAAKSPHAGYRMLYLECKAKGNFDQLLDLLADLNRNPYLVGIEKLVITKSDVKNQQSRDVNIEIKVSSFVKR